jgi:hypothetical protein
MTIETKIQYLIMALSLQQIQVNEVVAEAIIKTYEGILEKEGEFSINDIAKIHAEVLEKHRQKETPQESK